MRHGVTAITKPNDAQRVTIKFEKALRGERSAKPEAARVSAYVGGATFAFVSELTKSDQRKLNTRRVKAELGARIRKVLVEWVADTGGGKLAPGPPRPVERRKGGGIGEILSDEEGRQKLDKFAVTKRLEDWAGPVAGAVALSRDLGVPRSTLNRWQHTGDVIGLLKGTRKHVYPLEQFVDGRPARGIADVKSIIGNPRVTWHWLRGRNPVLRGRRPIDLLKGDQVSEVVDAARSYFQQ